MKNDNSQLGYEKIGRLIRRFSIPCVISMLVNSLYNIVDQIFIGRGVGYLGNGATNVVFPLVITCLAFALMIGDGTSALFSIKLGEDDIEGARKAVGNGIVLSSILSIGLCLFALINLPLLLKLFGCTSALKKYALTYGYIITLGIPFMIVGTSLNSIIRADGSPKYSMISMVSGALLNVILDPIFIFVFHMGVAGAAFATIISQIVTFILNILYIKKFKSISITKDVYKLDKSIVNKIFQVGVSSFIIQISLVIVFSVENNLLGKYGELTKFGSEIPITVFGIVLKINQILNSIIIGIAVGSQPIIGYNYGAKNYKRVMKTFKYVISLSIFISLIFFVIFQVFPEELISIFGKGNQLYMEFACLSFRIFLFMCISSGIQIPSSVFFQSIGKSFKSAIITLSRQILILVPILFIFSKMFGLMGILYSGPVAEGLALILVITLLVFELKQNKYRTKL